MPNTVIYEERSATLDVAVVAGDLGAALVSSRKILDVGIAGDPKAAWVTGVYGIATVNGTMHMFSSNSATFIAYVAGTAPHWLALYVTTTGDGITFEQGGLGPITDDLFCISDGTFTANAGEVNITYKQVGRAV